MGWVGWVVAWERGWMDELIDWAFSTVDLIASYSCNENRSDPIRKSFKLQVID